MNYPKGLRIAAYLEGLGIIVLSFSLLASTPPTYMTTITVGSGLLALGLLCFLWNLRTSLKEPQQDTPPS